MGGGGGCACVEGIGVGGGVGKDYKYWTQVNNESCSRVLLNKLRTEVES